MRKVTLPTNFNDYDFKKLVIKEKHKPLKLRYRALSLIQDGYTVVAVSNRLQISARMIHRWLNLLNEGGIENLKDKAGRGRKQILDEAQYQDLADALANITKQKIITGELTQQLIKKAYDYDVTLPTAYNILKRLSIFIKAQRKYNSSNFK